MNRVERIRENLQEPEFRLVGLDRFSYPLYRDKMVSLYLNAYTTGEPPQYIDPLEGEQVLDAAMRYGFGRMAFIGQRLIGALIAMPLARHGDFPSVSVPNLDTRTALYIAEVMVHADFRGSGIGTVLMEEVLSRPAGYSSAVIRVWEENRPAWNLYRKLGFRPIAATTQVKQRTRDEMFNARKIYLHCFIDSD